MSHISQQRFLVTLALLVSVVTFMYVAPRGLFAQVDGIDVTRTKAELEKELLKVEREIEAQQTLLDGQQRERVSLERDVAILNFQIDKARLEIRQRNFVINDLGSNIRGKESVIGGLNEKLLRQKESLAQLIRKTNEIDEFTLVEIVLASENISEFFSDLDSFDSIKKSLNESFVEIADTKELTLEEKTGLEEKQGDELELRGLQELQKRKIERREDEKQDILTITKGVEEAYQTVLKDKQKTAAEIRATLFALRGSVAIPFETALNYANAVSKVTDVRPAFLLAIITEESNLGENVGNCNLPDDPPKYKWQNIMKAPRDTVPYLDITSRLGLDPNLMPLSCAPSYGWGGAMGPAQFIPSTWVLYEDRIGRATGQVPPNPWDPKTAFMASGLLLSDNGADRGGYYNERLAALRYFAGWKNAEKTAYAFYGDEVMEIAVKLQGLIDILASS